MKAGVQITLLAVSFCVLSSHAFAETPASLEVAPKEIKLHGAAAEHGLLVIAVAPDGRKLDVSEQAKLTSSQPSTAAVLAGNRLQAVADGTCEVVVEFEGQQVKVPVRVEAAGATSPPSFRNDVEPVLTRYGCNQGACHGKLAGQNGFRLSLRGYAPEWDHGWITREFYGRRISQTSPAESLLLKKPTGQTTHLGGRLIEPDSAAYTTLLRWIESGTPGLVPDEATVQRIEVLPGDRLMRPEQMQQLLVLAHYSDGRVRDVTWLAQFFSNDASLLEVTPEGRVKALGCGESVVRVHFQTQVQVVTFTVPYEHQVDAARYAERRGVIDEHVFNKLASLKLPPSPPAEDATFLRRVHLDLIGTLPTPEEVTSFLADNSPDKRKHVVDRLLDRPEWVDYWTLQLCDVLQNRKERDHDVRGAKGVRSMHAWVRSRLAANRPWHEIARDVLTSQGDSVQNPQIGYYIVTVGEKRNVEEMEVVSSVAQAFLGTRIGCAKCHNHPLERYTQNDYYHFAAYFARLQLQRKNSAEGPTSLVIATQDEENNARQLAESDKKLKELNDSLAGKSDADAEPIRKQIEDQNRHRENLLKQRDEIRKRPVAVRQPRTGEQLPPQALDGQPVTLTSEQDPRTALASWMTDPTNEYFSGAMVNRLWRHFFAVGLVEPVDDLRASNPPTNRELWTALNREFVQSNYNLKHLMRMIVTSRAYQLSETTTPENETDQRFYSHYYARRLPAEVLLDAMSQSVGVPERFDGYPLGVRAIQLPDPGVSSYFLGLFGRSDRVTACACERNGEVNLPQLLHLQCGESLVQKFNHADCRLKKLAAEEPDNAKAVEAIFLSALSRRPNDQELAAVLGALEGAENREAALQDVFWAVLNTKEFAFNH